jgi:uncharacterized protein (DUF2236 family)
MWVHVAFTETFLTTYQLYSGEKIDGDAYVRQWAQAVAPLGLHDAPLSNEELEKTIAGFESALVVSDLTKRVVRFIRKPPLSRTARAAYWWLFQAAVASLPTSYRTRLGLKSLPLWLMIPITRGILRTMRVAIGSRSPIEEAALERRHRLATSV